MIVRDIMTTRLVTVEAGDTLGHAANIFRQYQFHHLPVVRQLSSPADHKSSSVIQSPTLALEGLLTSQDIEMAVSLARQSSSVDVLRHPWQEQPVAQVMHHAMIRVTPTTTVAAAAQLLVERNLNALPVVEYATVDDEAQTILVGLITRSDLLIALARVMGAFEPGMQLVIPLPPGSLAPLARTLTLAAESHIQVRSIVASPAASGVLETATLRLGTINPAPLLVRLREAGIEYIFADSLLEEDDHA